MRIIIYGCNGFMGKEVGKLVSEGFRGSELHAGVDLGGNDSGFPCFGTLEQVPAGADCIVDFSNHAATKTLLTAAVKAKIPLVLATTGHTEKELAMIQAASKEIPIFFSYNMSMGVALLAEMAKKTAAAYPNANIEIVETHHNRKLDAPSGTAILIANAIKEVRKAATTLVGRNGHAKRTEEEIGIHSVRRGNIVGIHEVLISTNAETITLKHEAHSRALFAEGALAAAEFLCGKPAGLYNMKNILE